MGAIRKQIIVLITVLFHLLFPLHIANAIEVNFDVIDNRQGLSSDQISEVIQDEEGYIWIATLDGLNCYTGTDFKIYKHKSNDENSLSSSSIRGLCTAPNGKLWIATVDKGINILDRRSGSIVKISTTSDGLRLLNNQTNQIFRDSKDRIWITSSSGINMYNTQSQEMKAYMERASVSHYSSIYEDSQGHIIVGTWRNQLYTYDPNKDEFAPITLTQKLNNAVKSICEDKSGNLWLGTWADGLYKCRYTDGTMTIIDHLEISNEYYSPNHTFNIVYDMLIDHNDRLWLGTDVGLGIIHYPHQSGNSIDWIAPRDDSRSFNEKDARSLFVDAANTIWIGTTGYGVSKIDFNHSAFKTYTSNLTAHKHSNNIFRSFWYYKDELYTGISALGFGKYDLENQNFTPYTELPEFKNLLTTTGEINCIISFEQLTDRYLWLGTRYKGLYIFDTEEQKTHKVEIPISYTRNSCHLIEDHKIWIGSEYGLVLCIKDSMSSHPEFPYKNTAFRANNQANTKLKNSGIAGIIRDKDQRLWIAYTENGIDEIFYDEDSPTELTFQPSIENNSPGFLPYFQVFYEDSQGNLWLGSKGDGLWLFHKDEKRLENYSEKHAIPGDIVLSIIEDNQNQLWFSSNSGISCINTLNLEDPYLINYTAEDGLQGNIFMINSGHKNKDGELFFGGYHGFNLFNPKNLRHNNYIPPLSFTEIEVDRTPQTIVPDKVLKLSHRKNSIEFSFVALSYTQSENNQYQYKLEGYDDHWFNAEKGIKKAIYGKLPPGNYTFKVRGSNNNGIWNNTPLTQKIYVKKAPYNTFVAYLLYILFILMIFWVYFHYTNRNFKLKQAVKDEQNERLRAEKINQFKLKFFTNISHELLTPLSIISNAIEQHLAKKPNEDSDLAIVQRNTNRLTRLINQLLDFRKVENSSRDLYVESTEINVIISSIKDNFIPLCEKKNITFKISGNIEQKLYIDIDKIEKILHNLLSNAFKHTPEDGEIKLSYKHYLNNGIEYLSISVRDSGKGIPEDLIDQIFERFYRIDDRKYESGAGIGLAFTRSLLNLHKGNIKVENAADGGAIFTFEVPVSEQVYSKEEKTDVLNTAKEEIEYSFADEMDEIKIPIRDNREKKGELPKVLLVDDNHDMRTIMRNFLSKYFEIYESENGLEGLATLNTVDIDLIVSDIMMPEMDGITFCRKVKNNIASSHIPVILTTAKRSHEDVIEGYEAQADSYITKPVNLKLLMVRMINLINQRKKLHKIFSAIDPEVDIKDLDINNLDQQLLERINTIIDENLSDSEMTVAGLAKDVGISTSALYRKVKSFTGLSPNEYIRTKRLNYAAELLKQKYNPSEATYRCGFSDPSYFGACFKKQFGVPPRKYVESL